VTIGLRIALLAAIIWSFVGAIEPRPSNVNAAGLPQRADAAATTAQAGTFFQETGFSVGTGPLGDYFAARGGARTFGPPISNQFTLLGSQVQIFRRFMLKQDPSGTVAAVNLIDDGAIPARGPAGQALPLTDPSLIQAAPVPGSPDYAARAQAFVKDNAPDQWDGKPVGFYKAFLDTVHFDEAFPGGQGDRNLLPGMALEVWGVPVSRPTRDSQNADVIYLRWERGVMVWNAASGTVEAVPLGEVFKAVLTGNGLTPEIAADANGSRFLRELDASAQNGVARPGDLPDSILANAFSPSTGSLTAAAADLPNTTNVQQAYPYNLTPAPYNVQQQYFTPTLTPVGYVSYGTATATPVGYVAPTATPFGYVPPGGSSNVSQPGIPGNQPPAGGLPGSGITSTAATPGASTTPGSDPCYGDEQITYSPEEPRVGNELLIAVTSARPHPYGRLAGTERTQFVRERPGQKGIVWEWTVQPSYPGDHQYTFYVDSTIPCQKIQLTVREQLATKTLTPTKTPTPYGFNSNNGNGNDNNGNDNNGNGNDNNSNTARAPTINPAQYLNGTDMVNCDTFLSQAQAQSVLRADPSDPNHLDEDNDGVACESQNYSSYPNDRDETAVFRTFGTSTPTPIGNATPTPFGNVTSTPTPFGTTTPTPFPTSAGTPTATPTFNARAFVVPGQDKYNCVDFQSQADAQAVLRVDASDPNRLDTSDPTKGQGVPDGIACDVSFEAPEWAATQTAQGPWPFPYDMTPVATRIPVTPTPTGTRPTATPTQTPLAYVTPNSTPVAGGLSPKTLDGKSYLISGDGLFVGRLSSNPVDLVSVCLTSGQYGSSTSEQSVRNPNGVYGSQGSALSANNPSASRPPVIYFEPENRVVGVFTTNVSFANSVKPEDLYKAYNCASSSTP